MPSPAPLLLQVRTHAAPGSCGCSGWKTPRGAAVTPIVASHSFSPIMASASARVLSLSVSPLLSASMYWSASGRFVGVHHMFPDTRLFPPSCSCFNFSSMRTLAPASWAAMAAASPANPVPRITTSASRSHRGACPGDWPQASHAPAAATAGAAAAAPLRNPRRFIFPVVIRSVILPSAIDGLFSESDPY